jgi:hypothetical protein
MHGGSHYVMLCKRAKDYVGLTEKRKTGKRTNELFILEGKQQEIEHILYIFMFLLPTPLGRISICILAYNISYNIILGSDALLHPTPGVTVPW